MQNVLDFCFTILKQEGLFSAKFVLDKFFRIGNEKFRLSSIPKSKLNEYYFVKDPMRLYFLTIFSSLLQNVTKSLTLFCCSMIEILNIQYMEKIKKLFNDPVEAVVAISGLGLLGFYIFYARKYLFHTQKKKQKKNRLSMNLKELIHAQRNPNIIKIVITSSKFNNSREFSSMVLTKLNKFLKENNQNTLVNCAPLKLFHAGAQVFMHTIEQNDPDDQQDYLSYLENALKCELVIEQTITDIFRIKYKDEKVFMICDTNSLDLKVNTQSGQLWSKFKAKHKIQSKDLMANYTVVFHLKSSHQIPGFKNLNQDADHEERIHDIKIQKVWRKFEKYYPITYQLHQVLQENVQIAIEEIIYQLKPYLPPDIQYTRRRVFTKEL